MLLKLQHYFLYPTTIKEKDACQNFLEYLTQETHCEENLLYIIEIEKCKEIIIFPKKTMLKIEYIIDNFIKLDSKFELNINDKIRNNVLLKFEELKSYFYTNYTINKSDNSSIINGNTDQKNHKRVGSGVLSIVSSNDKVQQQIDTMIKDIDKNQDGQIQFEEFLQFLKNFNLMELIQNSYPKEDKVDLQLEREFIQQQRKSISTNNNTSTINNNTNNNTTNHNNNDNNLNENNNLNDEMIEIALATNSILGNNNNGINNNNFTITLNNDIAKDNNKKDLYNIVTYESPQELNDYLQQQLLNKEENKEDKDLENNNNTNKENIELINELEMIKSIKKAIIDNHPLKTYLLFHYCLQNDNFLQKILQQLQQQTNLKENVILQALLQCLTITLSSTSFIEFND
ncbi:hypothetical protein ABK040_015748 [Willaertia magna]